MGTPWQKIFCIGLCLVALGHPVFSAPTASPDEPTPAKKPTADDISPAVESEAGPTLPNPVASDDSKSKVISKSQPLESDESELASAPDESKPTDQPVTELQTPNFNDVKVVSVHQILDMNNNQKLKTAKRMGYKFSFETNND